MTITDIVYHWIVLVNKVFQIKVKNDMEKPLVNRIAWSLADVSELTGLSIGFLRNEVRAARLSVKRFGRRILVLDEELKRYLHHGDNTADSIQAHVDQKRPSLA